MTTKIINADLVLKNGIVEGGICLFDESGIIYAGKENGASADKLIDGEGAYLMPGFVDIHSHGGGGYDFMDASADEMLKISDFHLSHGTTTMVATTMTDTWDAIESVLNTFSHLGNERGILHGVHLEGPWLSPSQCGAQDTSKMDKPSVKKAEEILKKYPFVERISIAPETDPNHEIGRYLKDRRIVASMAHTDADFDETVSAANDGYTLMTHLYSGMSGVVRKNAYRIAGAVEAGLYDDRLFVEVIADGKHLPVGLIKLIYKCKGAERICLVTDSMRGAGFPDGEKTVLGRMNDGVECIIEDGVAKLPCRTAFAGSVATADRLMRTAHLDAGIPLCEVSKMLSATPSRVMGYADRGEIRAGLRADLVLVDKNNFKINKVFLKGSAK